MSTRAIAIALLGLAALACGDDPAATPAPAKQPPEAKEASEAKPEPKPETPDGEPAPEAAEGGEWESPNGETVEAVEAVEAVDPEVAAIDPDEPLPEDVPHAEVAHPGPCKVTWSTGAKLTFAYEGDGGSVKVDADGKGKPEACGVFTITDGKTTKVEVDEGCNDTVEHTIEPAYDAKANVATATFSEGEKTRDVTLIEVAGFTGLTPGYPLYAKRKDTNVYVRGGLARKATVKKPWQGPAMTVTFGYNKAGQLERIKEDHDSDGTTDRRLDYRYDDQGNVIAMAVTLGNGDTVQKGRANLDYSCHEK